MAKCKGFEFGHRVSDTKGNHGTVRYVGTVATSVKQPDRIWIGTRAIAHSTFRFYASIPQVCNDNNAHIGIEWDDVKRGKHDGSVTDAEVVATQNMIAY